MIEHVCVKDEINHFHIKGQILFGSFRILQQVEGGLKENPGVQRISPEHQKDVLTNLIPSDVFSKLNKKELHDFSVYSVNYKTFFKLDLHDKIQL